MERRYERLSSRCARATCPRRTARSASAARTTLPYLLVVIDELADLMMVCAAGGRGRDHPARAEVARRRHPPRARDAAAVGRRDHRHDQGERPVADRVRRLVADRLARDPRPERRREPARPGRHALQAARHLAPAARPGRVRDRGGDRADRRAVPRPARAGARRDAASRRRRCSPSDGDGDDGEFDPDEDPLLDKAIEIVVQTQTASVSLLQRRLRVGYTRAGRLIDMLERRGIISPLRGLEAAPRAGRRVVAAPAERRDLGLRSVPRQGRPAYAIGLTSGYASLVFRIWFRVPDFSIREGK